jgi:putative sterol carrier protein
MDKDRNQTAKASRLSRFAVVKDLTESGQASPADTLKRLRKLLEPSKIHGTLQLQILEGGSAKKASAFSVALGTAKTKSNAKATLKRTVELITTPETWMEIASGRLAPHDAYLSGRLRVRGSASLAQTMLKHVAGSDGTTSICGEEAE